MFPVLLPSGEFLLGRVGFVSYLLSGDQVVCESDVLDGWGNPTFRIIFDEDENPSWVPERVSQVKNGDYYILDELTGQICARE